MKDFDHGGNIYAHRSTENDITIMDFSANINPMGMSPEGVKAMLGSFDDLVHYPDPTNKDILEVIKRKYAMDDDEIIISNGAAEMIYAICAFGRHKKVIVLDPTFSEYSIGASAFKMDQIHLKTDLFESFKVKKELFQSVDLDNSLIFLGHPNNPDGQLLDEDVVQYVLSHINESSLLIIDESFIDFVKNGHSYRNLVHDYENLIVLHSLTKFYAVPGLRIGAAYMHRTLTHKIKELIPTWSVNRLSQVYGAAALDDDDYYEKSRAYMQVELERMYDLYYKLGKMHPIKGTSNFLLMRLHEDYNLDSLIEKLKERGILIRNCSSFANLEGQWFRIAIKTHKLNDLLFTTIKELLDD